MQIKSKCANDIHSNVWTNSRGNRSILCDDFSPWVRHRSTITPETPETKEQLKSITPAGKVMAPGSKIREKRPDFKKEKKKSSLTKTTQKLTKVYWQWKNWDLLGHPPILLIWHPQTFFSSLQHSHLWKGILIWRTAGPIILTSRGYPLPFILRHSFNPSKHTQPAVNRNTCIIPYSFENQSIAHSLKKFGLRTFFTNHLSIGQILRNPITRSNIKKRPDQQPYAIYSIGCQDCNATYVGETGRFIYNRISEHNRNLINKDPKSLIFQHTSKTGHAFNLSDPTCHYHNIKFKYQRLLIESFVSHELNSINRRIELPSQYHSFRKKQPSPSFSPDPSSSSPV
ncbi:hypothetical protein LAZ67_3005858 [Cordylochernes scorpioides]|uniref:GIY-YIG domain-containing protein n=1 Tax=Cordylochernes scorpioides TaxID=51811 RepID=A0ABY6KB16_9ARAC|nr:hypothetical protein LAZ67_3005858 [Cordylochernes scorpioides]